MKPLKILIRYLVAIITILFSLYSPITAFAHEIAPLTATPKPGEILKQSPTQVRLTFEEELSEQGSTLQVLDAQGAQADLGGGGVDLNDAQHKALIVGLPELAEGVYLVKWKVTLSDGDASQGEYYFGIGNVTLPKAPAAAPETGAQAEPEAEAGSPVGLLAALAGGAILIAAVLIFWVRKSRPEP